MKRKFQRCAGGKTEKYKHDAQASEPAHWLHYGFRQNVSERAQIPNDRASGSDRERTLACTACLYLVPTWQWFARPRHGRGIHRPTCVRYAAYC